MLPLETENKTETKIETSKEVGEDEALTTELINTSSNETDFYDFPEDDSPSDQASDVQESNSGTGLNDTIQDVDVTDKPAAATGKFQSAFC